MRRLLAASMILGACATTPGSAKHVQELEARVARLEATNARYAAALGFLKQVYDQQQQQASAEAKDEPAADAVFAVDIAADIAAGQVDGPASAPVTIVEGWDFACPYCDRVSPVLDQLVGEYGGKVRVVYKNLIIHPQVATAAHLAGCAAANQGKFVAFKRAFWTQAFEPYAEARDPQKLGRDNILAIATSLGLDTKRLVADMDGPACRARVDADMAELEKFHVSSTPTFIINGTVVAGALPKDDFKTMIDAKLKTAQASGVAGDVYYQQEIIGKGEHAFRSASDPKPH